MVRSPLPGTRYEATLCVDLPGGSGRPGRHRGFTATAIHPSNHHPDDLVTRIPFPVQVTWFAVMFRFALTPAVAGVPPTATRSGSSMGFRG